MCSANTNEPSACTRIGVKGGAASYRLSRTWPRGIHRYCPISGGLAERIAGVDVLQGWVTSGLEVRRVDPNVMIALIGAGSTILVGMQRFSPAGR